jgi:hypothetical protein
VTYGITEQWGVKFMNDKKINNSEWELEFAYRYDGYEEVLYKCWILENHEPWTYEVLTEPHIWFPV